MLICAADEETLLPLRSACQRHFLMGMPFAIAMKMAALAYAARSLD
jgi:hypothetical protein